MLILKFFAFLGALMALYLAAALQNGPDTTDANLCKLLRRFSSSLPDQCIPSLDSYGTAFAIFFILVCVLILLWDFRKHVLISVGFWGAVKRLGTRVEPSHVIILGLVIAAIGMAWQLTRSSPAAVSQADKDKTIISLRQELTAAKRVTEFYQARDRAKSSGDAIQALAKEKWPESSAERQLRAMANLYPPEKEFTKKTVRELRALYEGRTRLQADAFMADEKGKLIEAEGTVVNIDPGMAFLQISQDAHNGVPDFVECRFGLQWNQKLGTFPVGANMKIKGAIGPSQNGAQIYLQDCEIIS